jgi:predicted TIM-barrel fold metal-dependent hydrolase
MGRRIRAAVTDGRVGIVTDRIAHPCETAAACVDQRLEDRLDPVAQREIGIADDALCHLDRAVAATGAHRGDARDELGLADRSHLDRPVGAVHRAAFLEDGGDDVVAGVEVGEQFRQHARPEIRAAVARLATHGLALDAWCYHPQLADVIALARAVPQATIVMCHVGGVLGYGAYAGKKDEVHAAWRASMAELATCPNVSVKLGGMLNRGAALNFRELPVPPNSEAWAAAWRPYVEPCIELFGADRCNFESNFPVDKMGTGYAVLWNAFKRITARCSQTEKLALYSGTAKRLYHLD